MGTDILARRMMDLDDIIDQPKLAGKAFTVTNKEWSVLQCVNLDDPSARLDNAADTKALETAIHNASTRRLSKPREAKETTTSLAAAKAKPKRRRTKKTNVFCPQDVP